LAQVRQRNLHRRDRSGRRVTLGRFVAGGQRRQSLAATRDLLGRDDAVAAAGDDRLLDPRQRVLGQQLQHADVVAGARQPSVARFKTLPQLSKRRRQAPVAVDVRVIEVGRLQAER
jgi:hypothetical protein